MAAQGELVLLLAADAIAQGQVLRGQAHVERGRAVAIEIARAGIEARFHRNVVHVLDAAGDLHVLAAGGDALGGLVDRLQARAAVAIDGGAAAPRWEARRSAPPCGRCRSPARFSCLTQPQWMSSIGAAGTVPFPSRAFMMSADRSSARTSRYMPFSGWARPMGVRTASMTTA